VHQRSRVQREAAVAVLEVALGQPMQLVVQQGEERVSRRGIGPVGTVQQLGKLDRHGLSWGSAGHNGEYGRGFAGRQ
jgi:hypothetical protein